MSNEVEKTRRGPKTKDHSDKKKTCWFMATNGDVDLLGGTTKVAQIAHDAVKELAANVRRSLPESK